jgi:hypothetical protein
MVFEKIMQLPFPGRGGDRVSLARLFKAGLGSTVAARRGGVVAFIFQKP